MSKRPELVNTKKTGGSDLNHPRVCTQTAKGILLVCLSVCMCECVRASKNVRGSLAAFLSPRGYSISFYKLIRVPHPLGSVSVFVCLSVCQP